MIDSILTFVKYDISIMPVNVKQRNLPSKENKAYKNWLLNAPKMTIIEVVTGVVPNEEGKKNAKNGIVNITVNNKIKRVKIDYKNDLLEDDILVIENILSDLMFDYYEPRLIENREMREQNRIGVMQSQQGIFANVNQHVRHVGIILLVIPFITTKIRSEKNKLDQYECGVEPLNGPRMQFEIQFYLVGMIFVIFDIEISLLMPWALNIQSLGVAIFTFAMVFIFILAAGLTYEWKKEASLFDTNLDDAFIKSFLQKNNIEYGVFLLLFPSGQKDIIKFLIEIWNENLLKKYDGEGLRFSEKVEKILNLKVEIALENEKLFGNIFRTLLNVCNADLTLEMINKDVNFILNLAGDKSTDFTYYTKRFTLGTVYSSVFFVAFRTKNLIKTKIFI
ncbi:unnamed protein product, partial [Rotaria magnacalcarata]